MAQHPSEQSNVIPALFYDDATAALTWLEKAFGFETRLCITDDKGRVSHAETSYGDRTYRACDPEGHNWTFSHHVRDVSPAEMEAVTQFMVEYR